MSSPASWAHAKRVFEAALDVPEADRAAFVDTACAGNPALRDEVLSLLTWHNRSTGFLETPASQIGDMPAVSAVELIGKSVGPWRILDVVGQRRHGRGLSRRARRRGVPAARRA